MAYLTLRAHGGGCCGMAHIHGFGSSTNRQEPPIPAAVPQEAGLAYKYQFIGRDGEKITDRLDYLIQRHRSFNCLNGVLEVVLNWGQNAVWEKELTSRGFKRVNQFKNSNSYNTILVYHLKTEEYVAPKPPESKEQPLR